MADILFFSVLGLLILTFHIGLYKFFELAGKPGIWAFIPVYNWKVWNELTGRPKWFYLTGLIPVVNVFIFVGMLGDLIRSFGRTNLKSEVLAVLLPFFYLPWVAFRNEVKYTGPAFNGFKPIVIIKKTFFREWADALLYAGTAALFIRTFLVEAFMIPTASMERTMMVGDFLFVSKYNYGIRMPMIPLAVPFVHNKLPLITAKSYLDLIRFPYYRSPGLSDVNRNDIVVFNYPADDVRPNNPELGPVAEPSLKENYIKRCVAIPGDVFEVRNQQIYINGAPGENPKDMQFSHLVWSKVPFNNTKKLAELGYREPNDNNRNWGEYPFQMHPYLTMDTLRSWASQYGYPYEFLMTEEMAETFRHMPNITRVERLPYPKGYIPPFEQAWVYPQDTFNYKWNLDHYGPFTVPARGATVNLTPQNISFYARIIRDYEGHKLSYTADQILIDEKPAQQYTFQMNYYFMMGDNRNNSLDSRYWGFVPENHVVGKPLLVFMSIENGFRWDRLFKAVK
jgi:signal peptidase I